MALRSPGRRWKAEVKVPWGTPTASAEEPVQIGAGVRAQVDAQEALHVSLALALAKLGLGIGDEVAVGPTTFAQYLVGALVMAADEGDGDSGGLFPLTHEIALVVRQRVEECETDGFEDGALARAVGADDGIGAGVNSNSAKV